MRNEGASAVVLAFVVLAAPAFAQTIRCVNSADASCAVSYPTIQDAIDASIAGDTILVGSGTYAGGITVGTSVRIAGAQAGISGCDPLRPSASESVISDPAGGFVINANNVTIDGFMIQDADGSVSAPGAGMFVQPTVSGTQIVNNIFTLNSVGVFVNGNGVAQTVVERNRFDGNNTAGSTLTGIGVASGLGLQNAIIDDNCFSNNTTLSIAINRFGDTFTFSGITLEHNVSDNTFSITRASNILVTRNRLNPASQDGVVLDLVNTADISCNSILVSGGFGILVTDVFTGSPSSNITAHQNNLSGNASGALFILPLSAYATPPLSAENNWWGDASGPFNAAANPSGTGDSVSDNVTFAPFLITPTLTISCPGDISVEATSPAGAVVNFTVTANSECDPAPVVVCSRSSGATFPVPGIKVVCGASDNSGATAGCTFVIAVFDTIPPIVTCPADISAECTSDNVVTFSATATDTVDPAPSVTCVPPSGSMFADGTTTVNCIAMDSSGNTSPCSFNVTITDTIPPVISCPPDFSHRCVPPGGSVETFTATATDDCVTPPVPTVNCVPPSGSNFPIGDNVVLCTATDSSGNSSSCSFTISVQQTATIIASPVNQTVGEGDTVTLHLDAIGTDFSWRKNGVPLVGTFTADLTFSPVRQSDAGDYDCVVDNNCTPVTSTVVTLSVHPMTLTGTIPIGDPNDPNSPPGAPRNDPREVVISTFGGTPQAFVADFQHGGIIVLDLSVVPAVFRAFLPAPAGFTSALAVSTQDDVVAVSYYDPDNGSQITVYSATSLSTLSSFRVSPISSASLPSSVAVVDNSVLVVADEVRQTVQGWFYAGPNLGFPTGPAVITADPTHAFGAGYAPTVVKAVTVRNHRLAVVLERDSERIEVFPIRPNGSIGLPVRTFTTGQLPQAICLEPLSRFAFITNAGNDSITVIGPGVPSGTILTDFVNTPSGITLTVEDSAYLHLYLANRGHQTISHFTGPLGLPPSFFNSITVSRGSLSMASAPGLPVGGGSPGGDRIVVTSVVNDAMDDIGR